MTRKNNRQNKKIGLINSGICDESIDEISQAMREEVRTEFLEDDDVEVVNVELSDELDFEEVVEAEVNEIDEESEANKRDDEIETNASYYTNSEFIFDDDLSSVNKDEEINSLKESEILSTITECEEDEARNKYSFDAPLVRKEIHERKRFFDRNDLNKIENKSHRLAISGQRAFNLFKPQPFQGRRNENIMSLSKKKHGRK